MLIEKVQLMGTRLKLRNSRFEAWDEEDSMILVIIIVSSLSLCFIAHYSFLEDM